MAEGALAGGNTGCPGMCPAFPAAQTTINQFLSDDAGNVTKMKDLLENTQQAVEQFRASPGKKQIPVADLLTNPFRFSEVEEGPVVDTDDITSRKRHAEQKKGIPAERAPLVAAQAGAKSQS